MRLQFRQAWTTTRNGYFVPMQKATHEAWELVKPEPMTRLEKVVFILGCVALSVFPITFSF